MWKRNREEKQSKRIRLRVLNKRAVRVKNHFQFFIHTDLIRLICDDFFSSLCCQLFFMCPQNSFFFCIFGYLLHDSEYSVCLSHILFSVNNFALLRYTDVFSVVFLFRSIRLPICERFQQQILRFLCFTSLVPQFSLGCVLTIFFFSLQLDGLLC